MGRPTTVRLDDSLTRDLDALATATDRSRAWHIEQADRRYVADEAWRVEAIREARAAYQAEAEGLAPHDEVMSRLEARIQAATSR